MIKMKSTIYTRTGDEGVTSLIGGARVSKDSARLEAYGTVDELNSWIGLVGTSALIAPSEAKLLQEIQSRLFDIGAILAADPQGQWQPDPFPQEAIRHIESHIDTIDSSLPRQHSFILPGGHPDSARCHIARTVARRAERRIITLSRDEQIDPNVLKYINRLSDLLFVLARQINLTAQIPENIWQKDCTH